MDKLEITQGSLIQQTQYFIPVEINLSVVPACLGIWFFHLSRRTTVIQDLLVRRQFSLVPDNRTNVNVEAWNVTCFWLYCLMYDFMLFFLFISKLVLFKPFNKIGIHVYLVKHVMVSIYSEITSWHHICCSK